MSKDIIPSISDMREAAFVLLGYCRFISVYEELMGESDEAKKLAGERQGFAMVAQYLLNQAQLRMPKDKNDEPS